MRHGIDLGGRHLEQDKSILPDSARGSLDRARPNAARRHSRNPRAWQLADNPGRNEPGTGEINYDFLFKHIGSLGYDGWIGCEYKPKTTTVDGLGWLARVAR
jgi:hypothetical protein